MWVQVTCMVDGEITRESWHVFAILSVAKPFVHRILRTEKACMNSPSSVPGMSLLNAVVSGLQEVKGKQITILDLREIPHAVAAWFVVAHGTSRTQVEALAQSVEKVTFEQMDEKPWGKQGLRNGEWAILDYSDIVVHVFHQEARQRYALEELWGDANIETLEEV